MFRYVIKTLSHPHPVPSLGHQKDIQSESNRRHDIALKHSILRVYTLRRRPLITLTRIEKKKGRGREVELCLAGLSVYRSVGEDSAVWRYNLNWVRCPLRETKAASRKDH